MYVIHIYLYIYVYISIYTYLYLYICIHIYMFMYIYEQTYMVLHIYIFVLDIFMCMYICMYEQLYIYIYNVHIHMYIYMHVYICTYICTYTYIHMPFSWGNTHFSCRAEHVLTNNSHKKSQTIPYKPTSIQLCTLTHLFFCFSPFYFFFRIRVGEANRRPLARTCILSFV